MKRLFVFALAVVIASACSSSGSTPSSSTVDIVGGSTSSTPASVTSTQATSTTFPVTPTLTLTEDEAPEFAEFTSSMECEKAADDSNLQVIQAFVTAYNERDESRLAELFFADPIIADMSGIPHLAEDDWTNVISWAKTGWEVNDQFQLTRLVMYGGGSVFELNRTNDVLRANGIETLHHLGKVHSFGCVISQMVLYLPFSDDASSPECLYWTVFDSALAEGTTQDITIPPGCSG